ncbi:hypothetical protein PT285_01555 [Lactobacillus sp. ESL0791]|uniref:hypothetical protein n=1 Tax=Lactobacillus sp. ESL0791 TaxID=2983234 RepID=UPI0023FA3441|nr:hypothetical protein [Lactobacillus sp. ESL0791]MDF7638123.1 hypothetical protein [Lactobacillus sp. ESL0791]
MNPDFAIVLNFKLKNAKNIDFDSLVKTARDIGARAISADTKAANFKKACAKYTIHLLNSTYGTNLNAANVIDTMMASRQNGQPTIINIEIEEDGKIAAAAKETLKVVNSWMHMFGHAFNEGQLSSLTVDHDGFILENRHMPYQKYIFLKSPLPEKVMVNGLEQDPNLIEMIEKRIEPKFTFKNGQLEIVLDQPNNSFSWQVVRIQAHRPEDDIKETKF